MCVLSVLSVISVLSVLSVLSVRSFGLLWLQVIELEEKQEVLEDQCEASAKTIAGLQSAKATLANENKLKVRCD